MIPLRTGERLSIHSPVLHVKAGEIRVKGVVIQMSEKRRDSKGRILRTGESQRPDGRYAYKYNDTSGKPQFVYSWRLEPGDRLPKASGRVRRSARRRSKSSGTWRTASSPAAGR